MSLKEKAKAYKEKLGEITKFWDEAGDEELNDEKKQTIDTLNKEAEELGNQVVELKEYQAIREKQEALSASLSAPINRPDFPNDDPRADVAKTAASEFVNNAEFKSWLERVAPNGSEVAKGVQIESPVVNLKTLVMTVPATAGGGMIRRDYGPWPIDLPLRPLTIRDVITILRTGSNLIEYVRVNSLTRAAAIVPEATSTTDDSALKPQAGMAFEVVQTGVKTIAVWMPITRTILADVPQLQSMIDAFLRTDLELEMEEEIITGPGGANHFTGLENTANLTAQAFDTDMLTTTRKARTKAMIVGRARSTGFLMNPYDWEAIDLTKDAELRYYFGGPLTMGTKTLWGLPVIESEVIPQGTAYTGDLKQMVVWDREQPSQHITDSNRDFFERNIISVLTELRAAFGVLRPPAIVKIDLHAGSNS